MGGFHLFDTLIRLFEEFTWHPTKSYAYLDQNFGISKLDPFEQLGIYNMIKGLVNAQEKDMGTIPFKMTYPAVVQPIVGGGQRIPPSRRRMREGKAEMFG